MNRVARIAVAATVAIGSLVAISSSARVHAQASNGPRLERYGEVELRALPPPTPGTRGGRLKPFRHPHPAAFRRHKDLANEQKVTPLASAPSGASPSSLSTVTIGDAGFDGMSLADGGAIPPDTQVAVGPNHIFEAVNDHVRIWNRQTNPPSVIYDKDLGAFFGVSFSTTLTDVVSDPRIRYDAASGRWFASVVTLESLFGVGDWRLAVSQTSDPTGKYTLYAASFFDSFPDFPSLGLNDDKLALTGNSFTISTSLFLGSEFLVLKKADLIAGASSPAQQFFAAPQAVDTIQVAESLSSTSTLYMAAVPTGVPTSTLQLWSINGVPGAGGGLVVTTTALSMSTTLVTPPDAAQAGSPKLIATNDTRLLNLVYRNGFLWMGGNTGCMPAGDSAVRSCLHFAQVSTATATVSQEITFGESGEYYYYPAVEIDASNNLVTVFNRSSIGEFASVYTSGRNVTDGAGTFQTPVLLKMGLAAYDPSPYAPRWGDYSGAATDPFDGGTSVWVAGQYTRSDGGADWGTWIARVLATPSASVSVSVTTNKTSYTRGVDTTAQLTAVVKNETGAAIVGLPSAAFVTKLDGVAASAIFTETPPGTGTYTGTLDISTAAAGQHTVMVTATDARPISGSGSASFTVTVPQTVRVKSITYSTYGGTNNKRNLVITVLIVDGAGAPVGGATVSVSAYRNGFLYGTASGQSGTDGKAVFVASNAPTGCYQTLVTAVVAGTRNWDGVTPPNQYCK